MSTERGGEARPRRRWSRWLAGGLAVLLGMVLVPVTDAQAAGPAVVSVTVSITDPSTNSIITEVDASGMAEYSMNVAYGCSVEDCEDVQVVIDPTALDPNYGVYRKESAMVFIPPFSPAPPITGNLDDGYLVSVGDVAAGSGGSFALKYRINARYSGPQGGSFFIDGSPVAPRATVTAANSDNPAIGTAAATWVSSVPAAPTLGVDLPASTRTDQPVTVSVGGDARCLSFNGAGILLGIPWMTCAASYEAVVTLSTNAVYVPGSGGSYDSTTHTVTFAQTGASAAGGLPYNENSFQVTFPSSAYPTSGDGCVVSEPFSATETMTYLDGTVRTATPASRSIEAQNCTPFAKGILYKYVANRNAGPAANPILYIPAAPGETKSSYWEVTAANQSNVAGIVTITDDDLDQADLAVPSFRVTAGGPATVTYTLDDSTTDTVTVANGATWSAPAGRRITGVTATSSSLIGPNPTDAGTRETRFQLRFNFGLVNGATPGTRTNTATASIEYPGYPELGTYDVGSISRTVTLQEFTDVTMSGSVTGAVAEGGGTPIVGGNVTWSVRGAFNNVAPGSDYRPQYVFLAPQGWEITPGSAVVAGVADVTYDYRTVVYEGQNYEAVIATWPGPITDSGNFNLPTMTVTAVPTGSAVAGTNNQIGYHFMGDANNGEIATYYPTAYTDVTDFDNDTNVTERYAFRTGATSLAPSRALGVTKEICLPDASATEGCDWISDSSVLVGVPPSATSIKYRVTISNVGNADLSDVVAYDVLPWIGDTGLIDGTAGTPRGSTVQEVLSGVSDVSPGLTLSYSSSTNPSRPEVFSGTTDSGDWGPTASGAAAIRAQIANLSANSSVSFRYEAALVNGSADQIACNSVAATATTLAALEPTAVCATTQSADLTISIPERLPLQAGRPGTVPYTITNLGGSDEAPATVTVSIPADVRVTDLAPEGWNCVASDTQPDGSAIGPVTLECDAVDDVGGLRQLAEDVPEELNIPAIIPDPSLDGATLCFPATVSGLMFDPVLSNNDASACFSVLAADALLTIQKTDERAAVGVGEEYSYDLVVGNGLVGEDLSDVTVTDTLPAGVTFVSATAGGTVSGQGAADAFGNLPGGTVTWNIAELAASGQPGSDGDDGAGATGSTATVSVTVRVLPGATGDVVNTASASAADPLDAEVTLEAGAEDRDGLYSLSLQKGSDAAASGVRTGQTLTYSVTAQNTGTADFVGATIVDDLGDVLDDATFVAGSASVSVDGGAAIAVADPTGGQLTWTGTIPAGESAVLSYQVTIGEPGDGSLINQVATRTPFTDCDTSTGLDEDGFACAVAATTFAPTFDKSVVSFAQEDDGTWTIVYGLDVVNPGDAAAEYDLADTLAFGAGIGVLSAEVSEAPATVDLETWSGAGDLALEASVPAGATHHYEVTVTADAHALTGTPSAVCTTGAAGGFANGAILTLSDGTTLSGEACAEPVEPGITKELDGAPVQGPDGNWTVSYLITATNTAEEPSGGLSYTLEDALSFPSGLEVQSVTVSAPSGVSVDPGFTAGLDEIAGVAVTADTGVVDGVARVPAGTSATPAVHEYLVEVVVTAPAGSVDAELLACGMPGAGYGNVASLFVGADEVGSGTACADIQLPELQFTKTVDTSAGTRAGDRVVYTITATNVGDADFGTANPAMLVDDMTGVLDDARYNDDARASVGVLNPASPELGWSGALPKGDTVTITYSVTLTSNGDGNIVNEVGLFEAEAPDGGVPACAEDPAGNAGAAMCTVSFQLDTRSIASTGVDAVRTLLLPLALAALLLALGGLMLALRRRRIA